VQCFATIVIESHATFAATTGGGVVDVGVGLGVLAAGVGLFPVVGAVAIGAAPVPAVAPMLAEPATTFTVGIPTGAVLVMGSESPPHPTAANPLRTIAEMN